ncbi:sciellin [Pseudorasbora parva]|uniref:sciellin n=1 Tax=Pseudorasbora parva TaxID=51549 RepID=UPI00351DD224
MNLNTRYSSQMHSAPLDDLADSLMPTLSGSVQSVRSQTQVRSVYSETPPSSATLRSPLQTPESSSRPVSVRDVCTVCGNAIAGAERMILEELKIISHTSCFRCAVCRCDLGGLEAGKSLWVHRERVNCSNCFSKIRGQWYI